MAASSSLSEYRRKRDFARTAEPAGRVAQTKGHSFVVQKHAATRLHYDFRLELDGVLKSWAVTRGPSLDPGEKRLAVEVEDHPLDYGGFEGTIPKGEYGGGTVMLWDRGSWEPIDEPHEGLKKGKLHFRLHGERLKGGWTLVRMPRRGKEKRDNWLLIKERDETADESDPLLTQFTTSVKSGRSMEKIAAGKAVWHSNRKARDEDPPRQRTRTPARSKARALALPEFRAPQLATLVDAPPAGDDWVHELKYDGYRLLVAANGAEVRCYTRTGQDWTAKFPTVVKAIGTLDLPAALIDGEAVAFDEAGRSDFSTLQHTLSEGGPIDFFAFDLLEVEGEDLTRKPLLERKERLEALLSGVPNASPIHFSTHIVGNGAQVLDHVCQAKQEGIISKKADAPYRSTRVRTWLKIKCTNRQEFVIGGWQPSTKRTGFRSLLLGTFKDGELIYAGHVGTGFDQKDLKTLGARLKTLERKEPPFKALPREAKRGAKWVEPRLVAEIAFTEFTKDGILRHPSFQGLREDKKAAGVAVERPKPVEAVVDKPGARKKAIAEPAAKQKDGTLLRAGVRITNPDRAVFPGDDVSKADLVAYYEAVADLMLPHLGSRPLSLVRLPAGSKKAFFQKHDTGGFPKGMHHVDIVEGTGAEGVYFHIDDLTGILAAVQMSTLEFHIWGSRVDAVEKPDRIIFDLDPDVGLDFGDVRTAAFDIRDRLAAIGLATFPMLSGGKGIHVIAPLTRRAEWPAVKAFCKGFAQFLEAEAPDRYVANMAKAKRKGRIFVDYLRNERGSTAIAPYSTRARAGVPVAAPVTWDEVRSAKGANIYDVTTMPARAGKRGDPWPGYFEQNQSITAAMMKKVGAE